MDKINELVNLSLADAEYFEKLGFADNALVKLYRPRTPEIADPTPLVSEYLL